MERYHLDDLGWFQFEMLIQSLLKARCGLSVESWGKSGDFGRDAFSSSSLNFPLNSSNPGPFLFQVKFVENANAAGARPESPLIKAVRSEIARIQKRKKNGEWKDIKNYTLVTNSPLTATLRQEINDLLAKELFDTTITVWGSLDVADLLDQRPEIRRSFPQLLSLRDLDQLIETALGKEARERSSSAIEEARSIIPVFVPTNIYRCCWETLHKHHFVVLDGPPEVGKTAIAWMVAITQAADGWQALVCNKPDIFFQMYQSDQKQIFIADDAFGRTEYDVSLGREWERDLNRILNRIDKNHWLIWTSRKHILERALRQMDLQVSAMNFPRPSEVLVDTSLLTQEEKALILYRHAKSANLQEEAKIILKTNAKDICNDKYFTPERIRNFIKVILPILASSLKEENLSQQMISNEISKAIKKPTERMQKSFRSLSPSHKAVLLTLLSNSGTTTAEELHQEFEKRFGNQVHQESFQDLLDDLSESFINLKHQKEVPW